MIKQSIDIKILSIEERVGTWQFPGSHEKILLILIIYFMVFRTKRASSMSISGVIDMGVNSNQFILYQKLPFLRSQLLFLLLLFSHLQTRTV